jgi:carboxypeptidase C (cathepsin A)
VSQEERKILSPLSPFFTLFQRLRYITGESYAGHYIPGVGAAIFASNAAGKTKIPLKGLSIGDVRWHLEIEIGICTHGVLLAQGWTDPIGLNAWLPVRPLLIR